MKFCQYCGNKINEEAQFCDSCGKPVSNNINPDNTFVFQTHHNVPKCNSCGHIGIWKIGPVLRPIDFVIGIALLLLGVIPGIVYFAVVAVIRSNEDNREKICTNCGAKNMFSFIYQ